ncbi:MAG: metal-sensitive transcriptional regulator [Truepera sp.]|nr:metal-sensitive transcriptional regulator [Truepera sp.]
MTVALHSTTALTLQEEKREKIINRLKRLEGQVRGLQRMVDEERDCQEILTLLAGVRSALNAAGDLILEHYLQVCQAEFADGRGDIGELVRMVKLARG